MDRNTCRQSILFYSGQYKHTIKLGRQYQPHLHTWNCFISYKVPRQCFHRKRQTLPNTYKYSRLQMVNVHLRWDD